MARWACSRSPGASPSVAPNRDLYFVMATGHFQLPQFIRKFRTRAVVGNDATSLWMTQNPEIYQNALAALSMEHLGCTTWTDNAEGQYVPTGM